MTDARLLIDTLRNPSRVAALDPPAWTALIAIARAEQIIGTLAHRIEAQPLPEAVARLMADVRAAAAQQQVAALWEAEMARRALAGVAPVILLKGTAYAAAGLAAGIGRSIGDLDILLPRDRLDAAEAALLAADWEWVKPDPYDDDYYRRWMHELPPLIHRDRDRMIDVHHTILPLTARIRPDATAMIDASAELQNGLRILAPVDMVLHNVAHLLADGDLSGGLRNLWDFDQLVRDFTATPDFWPALDTRARLHGLANPLARTLRLSARLFGTPVDTALAGAARTSDMLYVRRLTARDGWGRGMRKPIRFAFYVRSHWIRMPPMMLARHLWAKARKRRAP